MASGDEVGDASYDSADVARVAGLLDQAAAEVSRYRRFNLAQKLFLEPSLGGGTDRPALQPQGDTNDDIDDVGDQEPGPDDEWDDEEDRVASLLPLLDGAAWAAMRYHIELTVDGKKERARLEPHFIGPDSADPLDTEDQSEEVVAAWADLANVVKSPGARAVLSHLVFQSAGGREHAQSAATAYIELAETDTRAADIVLSARVAVRLARGVGAEALEGRAMATLEQAAENCITGERTSITGAQLALGTLVREKSPRARELVEKAASMWGMAQIGQKFWHLKLQTATSDTDRQRIWRDRIAAATAVAEASDSNILKAARLRDVLALAETSGMPELRKQAATLVQSIRNMDLEMMHIKASSHRFEEQFEEMVASVLNDPDAGDFTTWKPDPAPSMHREGDEGDEPKLPTWYARMRAFAQHGPPTGDPAQNRAHVENQNRLAPLQKWFPTQLQTPEGLPLYAPTTEEERFELDTVQWETELLHQWTVIYAEALHRIADPEVPPFQTLVGVLSTDGKPSAIGRQLAESFYRYWAGDGGAAVHTTVPMLEALIRDAVIQADRGIFRLQKAQSPGQYVGLGTLLPEFYDVYSVPEKDQRFFNAVLRHPGGWNLRNLLSHGYLPAINGGVAALALYTALRVLVLTAQRTPAEGTPMQQTEDAAKPGTV